MARVRWREWEGLGLEPNGKILYISGHTDDTTDLITVIQQVGWADRRGAITAANILNLRTGWYGYITGEYQPHACDEDGQSLSDASETVEIAMPFTWIAID